MQDLESLRSIALECDIRGSLVVELIDRLQAAEKDRDDWKLHAERQAADATARMIQAMENGAAANALRDELNALREQKPVAQVRTIRPMECTATISWNPLLNGHCPFAVGGDLYVQSTNPVAQSRDSAEPAITDHEGRPLQYWGGKANANDHIGPDLDMVQQSPAVAVAENFSELLNRIVPRIDAGGQNPLCEDTHHCEYAIYRERERIHAEFTMLAVAPQVSAEQPEGAAPEQQEENTNYCALKSITDDQVRKVVRAFWRRIYAYRNDYGIELPTPLPVEFLAHMATALSWVDKSPAPKAQSDELFNETVETLRSIVSSLKLVESDPGFSDRSWEIRVGTAMLERVDGEISEGGKS